MNYKIGDIVTVSYITGQFNIIDVRGNAALLQSTLTPTAHAIWVHVKYVQKVAPC